MTDSCDGSRMQRLASQYKQCVLDHLSLHLCSVRHERNARGLTATLSLFRVTGADATKLPVAVQQSCRDWQRVLHNLLTRLTGIVTVYRRST